MDTNANYAHKTKQQLNYTHKIKTNNDYSYLKFDIKLDNPYVWWHDVNILAQWK